MNFLKNLFGGGAPRRNPALDIYVRPKRCTEIVHVRIDLYNDLSISEDGDGFYTRKSARAIRCPFAAEVELHFDKKRQMIDSSVTDGELVTAEDYAAWQETQSPTK